MRVSLKAHHKAHSSAAPHARASRRDPPHTPASAFDGERAFCGACSYIYSNSKAFESQPSSFKCPVCKAPKSAFEEKDTAGVTALIPVAVALLLALGGAGFYLSKL